MRHPHLRRLRQLVARRSERHAERVFVVEGPTLLREALDAGARVESVYAAPGAPDDLLERAAGTGAAIHLLLPGVVERVSDTVTPQPVLAVVAFVDGTLDALTGATFVVVCVDVQDPGNAGTVLRSAEAAGADAVVCCGDTVDLYNPKTVRASAGSLFHVPVVTAGDPSEVLERAAGEGLRRLATVPRGGLDLTVADLTGPVALVFGNEAAGLRPTLLDRHVDDTVSIPMAGRTESLNVGMAAAVACFEVGRQRRTLAATP